MESRHRPIRIKTIQLQPVGLYFCSQVMNQPHQVFHSKAYHEDSEQVRNIIYHSTKYTFHRIPDIWEYLIGQLLGLRENGK